MVAAAAIYCRVSQDVDETGLAVGRQESDCRGLADRKGWPVAATYTDNDVSAYNRKKPRPEYQRLLGDLRAGVVDAVVVYHLDRLYRQPRELEDLIDEVETGRVAFAACDGDVDLAVSSGRTMARVLVAFANQSSGDTSRRQRRKMLDLAQAGRPHGGPRPYGFELDRVTLNEAEADVIRDAAARLLRGESLRSVALGLPGPKHWRRVLLSPRAAGLREHHGVETPATWPAIITADQRVRLQAILLDPARRPRPGRPGEYLLSGLLRCGECGARLSVRPVWRQAARRYGCPSRPRGCARISVAAEPVESWVTEAVLALADEPVRVELPPEPEQDDPADAIAAARETLAGLGRMLAEGSIGIEAFRAAQGPLTKRIEDEMTRLAARVERSSGPVGRGERLREVWPELTTDEKRAELAVLIDHVVVNRSEGSRFDPNRLVISPR